MHDPAGYDWNDLGPFRATAPYPRVVDETLRDGLQSPSVVDPPLDRKIAIMHAMAAIGVDVVSIGLPAAGQRAEEHAVVLARELVLTKLPIAPTAAGRTTVGDVQAIARVAARAGVAITVYAFIGSSPIRRYVEGWAPDFVLRCIGTVASAARDANMPVRVVLEDATRTSPATLATLFRAAVDAGIEGIVLCDTVGHATPDGTRALVTFARSQLAALGVPRLELDWHGHNDRGAALSNAVAAVRAGIDRVHGTALGVGERAGNVRIDHLLAALARLGTRPEPRADDVERYSALAADGLGWPHAEPSSWES